MDGRNQVHDGDEPKILDGNQQCSVVSTRTSSLAELEPASSSSSTSGISANTATTASTDANQANINLEMAKLQELTTQFFNQDLEDECATSHAALLFAQEELKAKAANTAEDFARLKQRMKDTVLGDLLEINRKIDSKEKELQKIDQAQKQKRFKDEHPDCAKRKSSDSESSSKQEILQDADAAAGTKEKNNPQLVGRSSVATESNPVQHEKTSDQECVKEQEKDLDLGWFNQELEKLMFDQEKYEIALNKRMAGLMELVKEMKARDQANMDQFHKAQSRRSEATLSRQGTKNEQSSKNIANG